MDTDIAAEGSTQSSPDSATPAPAGTRLVVQDWSTADEAVQTPAQPPAASGSEVEPVRRAEPPARRPAPFTYVSVASHHCGAGRVTASATLDAAGGMISGTADRLVVRQAAMASLAAVAVEEAADRLDSAAAALDGSWNGSGHDTKLLDDFNQAWGAFHDASTTLVNRRS